LSVFIPQQGIVPPRVKERIAFREKKVRILSPLGYQHIGYPVAATFHRDTVADNHSLDELCIEIAKP